MATTQKSARLSQRASPSKALRPLALEGSQLPLPLAPHGHLPSIAREWEFWTLAALVLLVYASRMGDLSLRGEETRWAGCAREILATGDWIVPRQQGLPFPDRPPLANWLMAASFLTFGESSFAVRLPSLLAVVATSLLVYWYSRSFLSRASALAAGAAYATMGEVLGLCRLAETDALLTSLVTASLLVWHGGYARCRQGPSNGASQSTDRAPVWFWIAGYAFAALAGLAKGPQGPVYFGAAVCVYLAVCRDLRSLFSWQHAAGIAAFCLIIGAWLVPYYLATDGDMVRTIWGHQASRRFDYSDPGRLLEHLALYPLEVLACMLPWSLFLWAYVHRSFRETIGSARSNVVFLATAAAVAFPTVWIATTARTRYFLPLYPCFAVLIGLVIERCWQSWETRFWERAWRRFVWMFVAAMPLAALGVIAASHLSLWRESIAAQPAAFAWTYALSAAACTCVCLWSLRSGRKRADHQDRQAAESAVAAVRGELSPPGGSIRLDSGHALALAADERQPSILGAPPRRQLALIAITLFIGLTYTGAVVNTAIRTSEDVGASVARLKQQLPADARLVSLDKTHHRFAWHYREPIPVVPWPADAQSLPEGVTWFCYEQSGPSQKPLPFAWERVAEVSVERNRMEKPWDKVVVGRVLR
jgi:4-amino-4-deoxy-L-arabinose transferase-like glycosyltransferase